MIDNKDLNKLTRKELLTIAKVYNIKKRTKMKKDELVKAIKKARKPIEELKKIEIELKKAIEKKEEHLIALPKEPEYVFVSWATDKNEVGILKIIENGKEKFELPVNLKEGKSYIRVENDSKVKAELGIEVDGKFKNIMESNEILVPTTKQTEGNVVFKNINTLRKEKQGKVSKKEMEKYIESEEKTAKELKYLRYGREGK